MSLTSISFKFSAITTLLFFLHLSTLIAQNPSTQDLQILKKIDSLKLVVSNQQVEITELKNISKRIESLEVKESYFSSILKSQTAIFASITTGFFLLFGLLTYGGFWNEVRKQKEEFKKKNEELDEKLEQFKVEFQNLKSISYKGLGNTYAIIAESVEGDKEAQIRNILNASWSFFEAEEIDSGLTTLNFTKGLLKKSSPKKIILTKEEYSDIILSIDKILNQNHENTEIISLCSEIKVALKSVTISPFSPVSADPPSSSDT